MKTTSQPCGSKSPNKSTVRVFTAMVGPEDFYEYLDHDIYNINSYQLTKVARTRYATL